MIKTIIELTGGVELANSLLYASFNADTANVQWLAEITSKLDRLTLGLSFLLRTEDRAGSSSSKRQTEFVTVVRTKELYFKADIGYSTSLAERDFTSVFTNLRYEFDSYGRLELWSDISEIDHVAGRINCWYAFVKNQFRIFGNLSTAIKLSHAYYRNSEDRHQTIISFDISCLF